MLQKTVFTLSFLVLLSCSLQIQAQDYDYGDSDQIIGTTCETDYVEITFEEDEEATMRRMVNGVFLKGGVEQGNVAIDSQPSHEGVKPTQLEDAGSLGYISQGYFYFIFNDKYTSFEAHIGDYDGNIIKFSGTKKKKKKKKK